MAEWVDVCGEGELDDGAMTTVDVGGELVAVARSNGSYYAFDDTCTHEECSLSEGILTGTEVDCPCHGSVFDLRTGEALVGPALESVQTYRVRVEAGRIRASEHQP